VTSERAAPPDVAPGAGTVGAAVRRFADGDTTHLCTMDGEGLGVSLTQSNALDFGSHLVEPSTGVFLHNRGVGFSLVAGHPAEVGPGRRPPHTLSPMLVTGRDGALTHLVGAMGGDGQPQIINQLLARLLRAGQDPPTAITAARLVLDAPSAGPFRLWWGDDLGVLVESDAPPSWRAGLEARGHRVRPIRAFDPVAVGCAQIIASETDPGGRRLVGASDPRSPEGGAVGR
jgi:gamma-glutamyltranspeptidase/glutathione hydrolase